jgi:hypothetical protein
MPSQLQVDAVTEVVSRRWPSGWSVTVLQYGVSVALLLVHEREIQMEVVAENIDAVKAHLAMLQRVAGVPCCP